MEPESESQQTTAPAPRLWSLQNIVMTLVVGVVIAGVVWYVERPGDAAASQSVDITAAPTGSAPKVGQPAPDFIVPGLDGSSYKLSDFKGKPVWIVFWASWCPPCRAENPDIQAIYAANQDSDLVVLAVDIGEDPSALSGYVKRTSLTFPIGLDLSTEVAATYRIAGIPTHYFIDRDGVLREMRIGGMSKKSMEQKVKSLLAPAGGK